MAINVNGTEIDNAIFNGTECEEIIFNGVKVLEKPLLSWQKNTYTNTGVGNGGGRTYTYTQAFASPVKVKKVYYHQLFNVSKTTTLTTYASTDNLNWIEIAKTTLSSSGSKTIEVKNPFYAKYYKVTQYNNNWRRDDGNDVYSIEPWRLYYYK